tara:strand:+ start:3001 stop:4668 length:1668 start_codon:yes stop_codon:yes gene_type:complete
MEYPQYKSIKPFDPAAAEKIANSLINYGASALTERQRLVDASEARNQYEQYRELSKFDIDKKTFDGNVKDYFMGDANDIYDLKNQIDSGELDPSLGAQLIMAKEKGLSQYGRVKNMLATDALYFKDLGPNGSNKLSKLNDPDIRMLFNELWKDSGAVTLKDVNGKLALVGAGLLRDEATGKTENWDYQLGLDEYEILRSKMNTVVIPAATIQDLNIDAFAKPLTKDGSFVVEPNQNKDIKYYDVDALTKYLKSELTGQGMNEFMKNPLMSSVFADWMPTQFDTDGKTVIGGGMRDIAIDDPRFKNWSIIGKDGKSSEQYENAKDFLVGYVIDSYFEKSNMIQMKDGKWTPIYPEQSSWDKDNTKFKTETEEVFTPDANNPDFINMGNLVDFFIDPEVDFDLDTMGTIDKNDRTPVANMLNNLNPQSDKQTVYSFEEYKRYITNNDGIEEANKLDADLKDKFFFQKEPGDPNWETINTNRTTNVFSLLNWLGDKQSGVGERKKFNQQAQVYIDKFIDTYMVQYDTSLKEGTITQKEYDRNMKRVRNVAAGNAVPKK